MTPRNRVRWGRQGGIKRMRMMTLEQQSAHARKAVRARWAKTSPEERSELARKAVQARWARAKEGR
jgi:hypothetical protein